jgi:hypothetical protein
MTTFGDPEDMVALQDGTIFQLNGVPRLLYGCNFIVIVNNMVCMTRGFFIFMDDLVLSL